jgi:hypothetical protein
MDKSQLAAAIKAVSSYVHKEFAGSSIMDSRDHDRSAHTWSVKPAGTEALILLTVSFEFLSDTPPALIQETFEQWDVADTMRGAEAKYRVLVTRGGVSTIPR